MESDPAGTYYNPYAGGYFDPNAAAIPGVPATSLGLSFGPTPTNYSPPNQNTFVSGAGAGPGGFPTQAPAPSPFDPTAFQTAQTNLGNTSYDDVMKSVYQDQVAQMRGQWGNLVRLVPGAQPGIMALPGSNIIYNAAGQQLDPSTLDPETVRMAGLVAGSPGNIPTLSQAANNGYQFTGRGFHLAGAASPQEQSLLNAFNAGDNSVYPALAQARMKRWQINQPSGIQQLATKVYGPLLTALVGGMAIGPIGAAGGVLAGAGAGAAYGGLTAAGMSHLDPKASAIGAGAGAVGGGIGGAAGAGATALGAGPGTSAVASGAAGGAAGSAFQGGARGNLDWRNVAIGAAAGGAGGAAGYGVGQLGSNPGSYGAFGETAPTAPSMNPYAAVSTRPVGSMIASGVGTALNDVWSIDQRNKRRLNPYSKV